MVDVTVYLVGESGRIATRAAVRAENAAVSATNAETDITEARDDALEQIDTATELSLTELDDAASGALTDIETARTGAIDDLEEIVEDVEDALAAASLVLVQLHTENGLVYALFGFDEDGVTRRLLHTIDPDAVHRFFGSVILPDGTVTTVMLADELAARVPFLVGDETGYIAVMSSLDADGFTRRLIDYVDLNGRRRGRIDAQALQHPSHAENASFIAFQHDDGEGNWQIRSFRKSDGQMFTLTDTGVCVDPRFSAAGDYVFYSWSDAPLGTPRRRYVPAIGGTDYAVLPEHRMRLVGDSLTQFDSLAGDTFHVALDYDWIIVNDGVASQKSDHIAARMGAIDTIITVTGNSVPASGTVAVTALTTGNAQVDRGSRTGAGNFGPLAAMTNASRTFTYGGQQFILSTNGSYAYFVEQVGGTGSFAFPAATAVRLDQDGRDDMIYSIWAVTNSGMTEPIDTKAQVAAIVASVKSWGKQYLITGMAGSSDGSTNNPSANYTKLATLNADLLALYPDNFIDPYKFLRGDAPYNGVTAEITTVGGSLVYPSALTLSGLGSLSAQGLVDIANGTWPIDFAASAGDRLHWNATAYAAHNKLRALIIEHKGWNQ